MSRRTARAPYVAGTLDKAKVHSIAQAMEEALQGVAARFNVQVTYRGGTFGPDNATLKFVLARIGDAGVAETPERTNYKLYHHLFGLPADGLDTEVHWAGDTFRITGLKPKGSRYPLQAERVPDGKRFKLPTQALTAHAVLGRK